MGSDEQTTDELLIEAIRLYAATTGERLSDAARAFSASDPQVRNHYMLEAMRRKGVGHNEPLRGD